MATTVDGLFDGLFLGVLLCGHRGANAYAVTCNTVHLPIGQMLDQTTTTSALNMQRIDGKENKSGG